MDADEVIEEGYEEEAKSIESPRLLEAGSGSMPEEGLPLVDLASEGAIDDFEALEEVDEIEAPEKQEEEVE